MSFTRCEALKEGWLCPYEGTMRFAKNQKPVCILHRQAIVAGRKVEWATKRMLAYDGEQVTKRKQEAARLAALNEEYYNGL